MRKGLLLLLIVVLIVFSCKKETTEKTEAVSVGSYKHEIERVFYSLPSPMEVADNLAQCDLVFDPSMMHNIPVYSNYETDFAKAVNLGMYSADLSYAIVYDQKQYISQYYDVIIKMSDDLGILSVVSDSILDEFRQNLDNPYKLQQLISQVSFLIDAFLQDAHRENIATLMLFGGWIETMYLPLTLNNSTGNDSSKHNCMVDFLGNQALSIPHLRKIVEISSLSQKDELLDDIDAIYKKIIKLQHKKEEKVYDKIADTVRTIEVITYNVDTKKFKDLTLTVSKIRNKYVNLH